MSHSNQFTPEDACAAQQSHEDEREMMENHATQLRERLQQRQRWLDQREADQHARQAQLEAEWRADQLRLQGDLHELQEQTKCLAAQKEHLSQQRRAADAAIVAFEEENRRITAAAEQLKAQLVEREAALARREKSAEWSSAQQAAERQELVEQRHKVDEQRNDLEARSCEVQESLRSAFERLTTAGKSLDQRYDRLAQLRAGVIAMHHEALRLHAATEQLWMQLNPGVEVPVDWNEIRHQMAASQRLADEPAAANLDSDELIKDDDREEFRRWYQHHRHELEAKASRALLRPSSTKPLGFE